MALILADRVRETSTTAGTGTITLTGAVAGFKSFSTIGNGNTTYYSIVDRVTNDWEVGVGTYTSSGTTLSRNTVLSNSLGTTALINFGANQKDVFVTYPADRSVYEQSDGSVVLAANTTSDALRITQTGSGNAFVVEDSTSPDTSPFVIDASGRLIVNNSSIINVPNYANSLTTPVLQILGTNGATGSTVQAIFDPSNYAVNNIVSRSRGTVVGDYAIVNNADRLYSLSIQGSDGTGFIRAAEIAAFVDGTPGTNDMPGRLVFATTPSGESVPTERMRIDSAGNLGIGAAAPAGQALRMTRNITGSTSAYAANINPTFQSDVTTGGYVFQSIPSTQATAFTMTSLRHFYATQGTIGAGSTVTNQFGFAAESGLTGATNNYGFYGNIAAGTGRYNFYANGTAANYFAGVVSTGSTISDVSGDLRSIPQNAKTAAYTLIATDNGKHISITTGGVTVPASVFSVGNAVTIFNNSAAAQTITQGASVTLYNGSDGTSGNRTLGARGIATVLCVATNTFVITGAGLI